MHKHLLKLVKQKHTFLTNLGHKGGKRRVEEIDIDYWIASLNHLNAHLLGEQSLTISLIATVIVTASSEC